MFDLLSRELSPVYAVLYPLIDVGDDSYTADDDAGNETRLSIDPGNMPD